MKTSRTQLNFIPEAANWSRRYRLQLADLLDRIASDVRLGNVGALPSDLAETYRHFDPEQREEWAQRMADAATSLRTCPVPPPSRRRRTLRRGDAFVFDGEPLIYLGKVREPAGAVVVVEDLAGCRHWLSACRIDPC